MPHTIKTISTASKEEAIEIMKSLTDQYHLILTDPDNSLDASNNKWHVFYDTDEQNISIETNDANSVEERLKELLADFPTFF